MSPKTLSIIVALFVSPIVISAVSLPLSIKFSVTFLVVLANIFHAVSGHYLVNRIIVNGAVTPKWAHMLESGRVLEPVKGDNIKSTDFRFGPNAWSKAGSVTPAKVTAGSRIGFILGDSVPRISHPGPTHIYMSKAPGDIRNYRGDGDWFKVFQDGVCGSVSGGLQDTEWCSWQTSKVELTLPRNLPNGQYLIRWEHLGLHGAHLGGNNAEFFFICGWIEVTGGGNGVPGPLVKIPSSEVYSFNHPGLAYNKYAANPSQYQHPGPAVWNGAGSSDPQTTSRAGQTTTRGSSNENCASLSGQCGGNGWTGPGCCSSGSCKASNEWYS